MYATLTRHDNHHQPETVSDFSSSWKSRKIFCLDNLVCAQHKNPLTLSLSRTHFLSLTQLFLLSSVREWERMLSVLTSKCVWLRACVCLWTQDVFELRGVAGSNSLYNWKFVHICRRETNKGGKTSKVTSLGFARTYNIISRRGQIGQIKWGSHLRRGERQSGGAGLFNLWVLTKLGGPLKISPLKKGSLKRTVGICSLCLILFLSLSLSPCLPQTLSTIFAADSWNTQALFYSSLSLRFSGPSQHLDGQSISSQQQSS